MNYVLSMRMGQGFSHLRDDGQDFGHLEQVTFRGSARQICALQEFHRNVRQDLLFPSVKNGHDILMLQTTYGLGFAKRPLAYISKCMTLEFLAERQRFDGHHTPDFRAFAEVHYTHHALGQFFVNLVPVQHGFFDNSIQ